MNCRCSMIAALVLVVGLGLLLGSSGCSRDNLGLLMSSSSCSGDNRLPSPPDTLPPSAPKILLHVQSATTKNPCTTGFSPVTCSDIVTQATCGAPDAGVFYYLYLVVAKGDSMPDLAGFQCGITYQNGALPGTSPEQDLIATDVYAFTLCATLEFVSPGPPSWLQPGGGNLITWDRERVCQTGELAVAGYWYVGSYGADEFRLTRRPSDNRAVVASCQAVEARVQDGALGYVAFSPGGTMPGCNPCLASCGGAPAPQEAWSGAKTLHDAMR